MPIKHDKIFPDFLSSPEARGPEVFGSIQIDFLKKSAEGFSGEAFHDKNRHLYLAFSFSLVIVLYYFVFKKE